MIRAREHRSSRGFTLLEVLIAIALILLLGGVMFAFLQNMLATRSRTLELAARQRAAATLIERIEADVVTCLVGDAQSGAGVLGDNTQISLLTRGVMPQLASRGLDDPAALGDLQRVDYRFDSAQQRLVARKNSIGESSDFAPLGGIIARVRFRYLDGKRWLDSFDSVQRNQLPGAIEVAVWFTPSASQLAQREAADLLEADRESFGNARAATRPGNFDEQAFADASDADEAREPPPDRLRVIVIPDAGADAGAENEGSVE